ncbi:cation:proton antiporter [Arthrobacter sulfonylureivorans]|uniref:Cation:proton antiporter n=1 Tax=Arthrobacter sulfonylureivorans TaxID=2486855 RepID=A0ABY3W511_9MICC|nr:cation:proton antiporter [Arthrobacter sulfonylureivorans]UNK45329.1 cation:proton antiporter [Arthrobacter sulfonylureivorans]
MQHLSLLLIELGILFAVLSGLGLLAHRLGLSPIPFYLLSGLLFGEGRLLPVNAAGPFVEAGAEIGVILLLLLLGLEFSATELMHSLQRHRSSGLVDFLLNAVPGFLFGLLLGLPWQAALALSGVIWVSSSGIIARLLDDLGRLGNRETPAVLSVLVLEDIAMALYLPMLVVFLSGGGAWQAAGGVALALGAVSLIMAAAHKAGHRVGRLLSHPQDEQVMLRLLGIALVVAGIAEGVGAGAAVGSFLVGIAIPQSFADRARQILSPLRDLFAAFFFLTFGLSLSLADVLPILPAVLLLAVVTTATKLGSGWYAAGKEGVHLRGRLRAGAALTTRGEFSVIIAGLAVAAGYTEVGPFAAAYVLILAVAGPLLTRFIDSWTDPNRRKRPH